MKRYRVHPVTTDGPGLDWSAAEVLTDFSLPWEQRPTPATEFRALWSDERLYFRFDCVDDDLVLGQGPTCRDRVLASDRVEIFLAPDLTLKPYFCFEMEPRGEVAAYRGESYRQFDWDWSCEGLHVSSGWEDARYHVQGSFSMCALREWQVLKPDSTELLAGVYRAEFSHRADGSVHSGWMPWVNPGTARPDFHVPGSFGVFELVSSHGESSGNI